MISDNRDVGVIFATPCLTGSVSLEFFNSTVRTEWALIERGFKHGYLQRMGDPYLDKVRNKLATDFLQQYPNATDLFFLDDDVGWPPEAVIRFLDSPEPVLAGIYPKKADELDFPVHLQADPAFGTLIERDGLVSAKRAPTGFLRIKRWVLEEMVKISGVMYDQEHDGSIREFYNIFECGVNKERWYIGEDFAFCEKWIGMDPDHNRIMVDPNIEFTHRGTKKWASTLSDHLQVFRDKAAALKQVPEAAE